jgi:hypothetical protein
MTKPIASILPLATPERLSRFDAIVQDIRQASHTLNRAQQVANQGLTAEEMAQAQSSIRAIEFALTPALGALALPTASHQANLVAAALNNAFSQYQQGDIDAITLQTEFLNTDPDAQSYHHVKMSFVSDTNPAARFDVVITMIESIDTCGLAYDHEMDDSKHWFHFKGEPVTASVREALFEAFTELAMLILSEQIIIPAIPNEAQCELAENILRRYDSLLSTLPNL